MGTRSDLPAPGRSTVRAPDAEGVAVRDGVRIAWARYGTTGPEVVLLPTWALVPSGVWKFQVPYLARFCRVTVFDGRGSGRSDRPEGAAAYSEGEYAADTLAVMDAAGVPHAVLVGFSCGVSWAVRVAAHHPERVDGIFALAPSCGLDVPQPHRAAFRFDERQESTEGWAMYNRYFWREGGPQEYRRFVEFFLGELFTEPHSTRQIEDCLAWSQEVDGRILADTTAGRTGCEGAVCAPLEPLCSKLSCPVTVLHGTDDAVRPHAVAERLAELTGAELLLVEGAGHGLPAREPVLVNHELRAFVERVAPRPAARGVQEPVVRTWTRGARRSPRALFLSSPIGLGHARRDLAVARALRELRPDLAVDWLTQDPVVGFLRTHGERVHPASAHLAGETRHVEDSCGEHDLNAFQAIRRMDEILVHNFLLFGEVVQEGRYDLVIGDEAWEVDHFLHENPELKRFAFGWLTDFVGWLPMPDGGPAEAALTADLNAQMLEQRARHRRIRDVSLFVGDPDDVVDLDFGPGLPRIRDWTREEFRFTGYITGDGPGSAAGDRERLRGRLGVRDDERLCVVAVGGSAVGLPLLRRVAAAVPQLRRRLPDLQVHLVAGPRIDPDQVTGGERVDGMTVHGFLPDLDRHLADCDVAVVQGGLSTCMELTAGRRPFVYVPLRNHFEQQLHVRHRLDRHGAGLCLDYAEAGDPQWLAAAVAAQLEGRCDPLPVPPGGAQRAAAALADLL